MTKNTEGIHEQREWLSTQTLTDIVNTLSDDEVFIYPKEVLAAISAIVISVNDSYVYPDDSVQDLFECIVQILQTGPVARRYMETSKSALARKPLMMQLLILMQNPINRVPHDFLRKNLIWLAIAMHTSVLLMRHGIKKHTDNILMQFKQAQFSSSIRRTWIWRELPDLPQMTISVEYISTLLNNLLEQKKSEFEALTNNPISDSVKAKSEKSILKAKLGQIDKITIAYQHAYNLQAAKPKRKKPPKNNSIKPIKLSDNNPIYQADSNMPTHNWGSTHSDNNWSSTPDDIEHNTTAVDLGFLDAHTETYEGLTTSFEEYVDHNEAPYISYDNYPDPLIQQSIPLQTIDLSLQQKYMAQRNLALNSNTRLLSLAGYQVLFAALHQDARFLPEAETNKVCAGILLLSMLTGLPVKSLLISGYIGHPGIFGIHDKRAYIQHSLGITKPSVSQTLTKQNYENHSDTIKIPLPLWLIDNLLACELPVKEDFIAYLADLRSSLGLSYLSINRIETALHVVLSRYTPDCHMHIADIICRTSAPHAPAMYYSSHTSETLLAHYKSALSVFNSNGNFDLTYITPWHKYTVGSRFALTIETVHKIINEMKYWTDQSLNDEDHFNRTSILVWFVFCLLTGVRPNNGLGKMCNIDLVMGWLVINDKPVKKVKTDRLIPLCPTLVRLLIGYRDYLMDYQARHQSKHDISTTIDSIRLGNDEALLKLLSASVNTLKDIKRGDAYHITKKIIDANPYWTRHFVRTQLEKRGVQISLINTVIGHEKARQEVLGRFSSSSKADIKRVAPIFEQIAEQLGLNLIEINNYSKLSHIERRHVEVDHAHR
ncbi:hypothetical protein [Psychrobacter celer]|uniref:hypothetical protein n=1 Tax=Psychrobacter celer TaxID=306572 RepID=UPI003FD3DD46